MNAELQSFARQQLKAGLEKLPEGWQGKFKLMYARDGGKRSVEDAKAMPIDAVVEQMPDDKLDWAMQQVKNSLAQISKAND